MALQGPASFSSPYWAGLFGFSDLGPQLFRKSSGLAGSGPVWAVQKCAEELCRATLNDPERGGDTKVITLEVSRPREGQLDVKELTAGWLASLRPGR